MSETETVIGFCPHCGGPVQFSHEDDAHTRFFKCPQCGEYSTLSKLKASPESIAPAETPELSEKSQAPPKDTCGHCLLWMKDECDYLTQARKGTVTKGDWACEKFQSNYFDEHGKFIPKLLADQVMKKYRFLSSLGFLDESRVGIR